MTWRVLLSYLFIVVSITPACADTQDVWLLVETEPRVLKVMTGEEPREVFTQIAIGRMGVGLDKARNDAKTPLGEYHIGWINENSKYHRFFGFTYPNIDNAKRAYHDGIIGEETFRAILRATLQDGVPPQNTALGGQIGIHGVGRANRLIHENFDWTSGCIAMTDEQIDRLTQWVRKGTLVVIR